MAVVRARVLHVIRCLAGGLRPLSQEGHAQVSKELLVEDLQVLQIDPACVPIPDVHIDHQLASWRAWRCAVVDPGNGEVTRKCTRDSCADYDRVDDGIFEGIVNHFLSKNVGFCKKTTLCAGFVVQNAEIVRV